MCSLGRWGSQDGDRYLVPLRTVYCRGQLTLGQVWIVPRASAKTGPGLRVPLRVQDLRCGC